MVPRSSSKKVIRGQEDDLLVTKLLNLRDHYKYALELSQDEWGNWVSAVKNNPNQLNTNGWWVERDLNQMTKVLFSIKLFTKVIRDLEEILSSK